MTGYKKEKDINVKHQTCGRMGQVRQCNVNK